MTIKHFWLILDSMMRWFRFRRKKDLAEETYEALQAASAEMTPSEKAAAEAKTEQIIERVRASRAVQRQTAPGVPPAKPLARSN